MAGSSVPERMRAVVLTGHGGLDKLIYREEHPTPVPGGGEVLVRVGACGLNNTDINTRTAWYSNKVKEGITDAGGKSGFAEAESAQGSWGMKPMVFPRIQGADAAGRIVAVGDGVHPGRIGERVLVDPWILGAGDWRDPAVSDYFGSERDGGFADYTVVPSANAASRLLLGATLPDL
ncbi:MAG: alcohol dehydrogenase catalytic domain-containing protein [Alphaproteobacteria bacterium]|nr:alcohol dehydrogenase catalytic domain-containing protein [Alphaproteobacteria bacterium]